MVEALKGTDIFPDSLTSDEKEELLKLAHDTIIFHLGDKVMRQVRKLKIAAEVWMKLESLYMTKF